MASVYPCIFYFVSSSRLQAVFPLIFRIVAAAPLIPATLSSVVLTVAPPLKASRDYTISAPLLMNIRAKFRQKRPFPTALGYGSRVIQLLLPTKSFRESSIEKLGQDLSAMFLSVTYTLSEVKESLSSSVLVSTNHLQTRCSGSPVVGSYPDFSMFFGTSVSGSKVKHLYGYLHPFNTSIVLIVVFFCLLSSR
uniref:Uncharacterized protein n=1 Tax=Brassica oleracea TaxID=3712 RepID=A0A3P6GYV2_BRAOL|nr:unnamed protein product [Brassica oleracea]